MTLGELPPPPYMYKKVWDPMIMKYVHRNFQTGEGLWDNTKAFGKKTLGSFSNALWRRSKNAATDAAKRQLADAAEATLKRGLDKVTSTRESLDNSNMYDELQRKQGKDEIFKILNKEQENKNKKYRNPLI